MSYDVHMLLFSNKEYEKMAGNKSSFFLIYWFLGFAVVELKLLVLKISPLHLAFT